MTHKNYSLIPVLAAITLIPQLLFWWLAPAEAAARLVVYIGGTLLTVGIPAAYLVTYLKCGLRKTAGLSVISGVLELAVIVFSAVLLGVDISVRSAVFAFIIAALVCMIPLIPLICDALREPEQGVISFAIPTEPISRPVPDDPDFTSRHSDPRPRGVPSRMPYEVPAGKSLPPRKH